MEKAKESLWFFRSIRGSTPVIIICTTLIVILVSAVVADIGYAAFENYKLNKYAEKSAVYGADMLTRNQVNVEGAVRSFAVKNISELNELDIKISKNLKAITVSVQKPFSYFFLQLIGFKEKQIKAKCTAKISNISSIIGVRPFAVEKGKVVFDKEVILSNKKLGIDYISITPINLGEGNFKANIVYGYRKQLNVGDGIYSLKGNYQKSTIEGLTSLIGKQENMGKNKTGSGMNENRILVIPVVDKLEHTGKSTMNIMGFTAFYIKAYKAESSSIIFRGMFIKKIVKGDTSDGTYDFGLSGIRLIH